MVQLGVGTNILDSCLCETPMSRRREGSGTQSNWKCSGTFHLEFLLIPSEPPLGHILGVEMIKKASIACAISTRQMLVDHSLISSANVNWKSATVLGQSLWDIQRWSDMLHALNSLCSLKGDTCTNIHNISVNVVSAVGETPVPWEFRLKQGLRGGKDMWAGPWKGRAWCSGMANHKMSVPLIGRK